MIMDSLLPIIPVSALQKAPRKILEEVTDYAVVRSHTHDVAFVLNPRLGKILLESGMLQTLLEHWHKKEGTHGSTSVEDELKDLIGNVLRELSKK